MNARERIPVLVRHCYWDMDINCARTTLYCLEQCLGLPLNPQIFQAAAGMHGAGRMGGQCGLLEGALLFLGVYGAALGRTDKEIVSLCGEYATAFTQRFGSMTCRDLRPGGFRRSDPPHLCEDLSVEAVCLIYDFAASLRQRPFPQARP